MTMQEHRALREDGARPRTERQEPIVAPSQPACRPAAASPAPARMQPTPLAGWRQRLAHATVVAAGWTLFAWSWRRVSGELGDSRQLQWLLLGAMVVVPTLTVSWVLHNIGIHRRRGARRAVPAVETRYVADFNGRRIAADWSALAGERWIEVGVAGEVKYFRPGLAPAARAAEARAGGGEPELAEEGA